LEYFERSVISCDKRVCFKGVRCVGWDVAACKGGRERERESLGWWTREGFLACLFQWQRVDGAGVAEVEVSNESWF
jgi:hypothetical protein